MAIYACACRLHLFRLISLTLNGYRSVEQHVKLNGPHILPEHCVIEISEDGEVSIFTAPGALAFVNGFNISEVLEPTPLCNGDRLILGSNHYFRFHFPAAAVGNTSRAGGSDAETFDTDEESRHFTWGEAHREAVGSLQDALGDKIDLLDLSVAGPVRGPVISNGPVVPAEELVGQKLLV